MQKARETVMEIRENMSRRLDAETEDREHRRPEVQALAAVALAKKLGVHPATEVLNPEEVAQLPERERAVIEAARAKRQRKAKRR